MMNKSFSRPANHPRTKRGSQTPPFAVYSEAGANNTSTRSKAGRQQASMQGQRGNLSPPPKEPVDTQVEEWVLALEAGKNFLRRSSGNMSDPMMVREFLKHLHRVRPGLVEAASKKRPAEQPARALAQEAAAITGLFARTEFGFRIVNWEVQRKSGPIVALIDLLEGLDRCLETPGGILVSP